MTDIKIPNNVTSVGESAFSKCTGLTSITIPKGVTSIDDRAFENCTGLISVVIPDGVTNIGNSAFYNCTGLKSIEIPGSITNIGSCAFYSCTGLTNIEIPGSVTNIGNSAFNSCKSLVSITMSNGVTYIGDNAFYSCKSLTSIAIPNTVTNVGDYAFKSCSKLYNITIPDKVICIGQGVFEDTKFYKDMSNWEDNVLYIGKHLINAKHLVASDYTVKDGTKTIVEFLEIGPLNNTNTVKITIPQSVKLIKKRAFIYCKSLQSVCILSNDAKIEEDVFPNNTNLQIIAPKDSSVYNTLNGDYNVIPYSFTVNKDDKDKPMLALDGKVVLTEDMWSCICRLVKDTDVQYIYFKEFDFGDMMPEYVIVDYDKDEFKYKDLVLSIIKDGDTIRLGMVDEKKSFFELVEALVEQFIFTVENIIRAAWRYIFKHWK